MPSTPAAGQSLQGKVETIGVSTLTLQTSDGKTVTVDTSGGKFQAQTVRPDR